MRPVPTAASLLRRRSLIGYVKPGVCEFRSVAAHVPECVGVFDVPSDTLTIRLPAAGADGEAEFNHSLQVLANMRNAYRRASDYGVEGAAAAVWRRTGARCNGDKEEARRR